MLGVDVGGTFTDVVAIKDGEIRVTKVPSVPDNPHQSVLEGAQRLGVKGAQVFNHASTKGLNAVLTRRLPKVGFLTTDGHRDILDAGRAWRPFNGQTDAGWRRSFGDTQNPLVPRYLRRGVKERILANGDTLIPLNEDDARQHLELLKHCNIEGLAICLLNSYVNPSHELSLKALAIEVLGDIPISISYETSPKAKEYSRASTTVIDVMMKLLYEDYAFQLNKGLSELGFTGELNFADCSAALLPWQEALKQPYRIIFAGPAAGTASCLRLGETIGENNLVCCDVGGTSTDISLILDGSAFTNDTFELEFDLLINALSTEVSSVGAGGGSLVSISPSGDIVVGPGSAGAIPGPACYQRGGKLPTLTDACALIGILNPVGFAGGQLELDLNLAKQAFASLDSALPLAKRIAFAYRIAVNNIAEEVMNVAIRHGTDPRELSLVAYGSAGPMLLADAQKLLQLKKVIIPPHPGLFSAIGLISTDLIYSASRSAYLMLSPDSVEPINTLFSEMETDLRQQIPAGKEFKIVRSFDGRLMGQSWETPFVELPDGPINAAMLNTMSECFHTEYLRRNGQNFTGIPVQAVSYRVQIIVTSDKYEYPLLADSSQAPVAIGSRQLNYLYDEPLQANIYARETLMAGDIISGPAIIQEELCTTFVTPDQIASIGKFAEIYLTLKQASQKEDI